MSLLVTELPQSHIRRGMVERGECLSGQELGNARPLANREHQSPDGFQPSIRSITFISYV